eukprot:UN08832
MYERLTYPDRFQNIKVLGNTLRLKEPTIPQYNQQQQQQNITSPSSATTNTTTKWTGQTIMTKQLAHHLPYIASLSPINRNNPNNQIDISGAFDMETFLRPINIIIIK